MISSSHDHIAMYYFAILGRKFRGQMHLNFVDLTLVIQPCVFTQVDTSYFSLSTNEILFTKR